MLDVVDSLQLIYLMIKSYKKDISRDFVIGFMSVAITILIFLPIALLVFLINDVPLDFSNYSQIYRISMAALNPKPGGKSIYFISCFFMPISIYFIGLILLIFYNSSNNFKKLKDKIAFGMAFILWLLTLSTFIYQNKLKIPSLITYSHITHSLLLVLPSLVLLAYLTSFKKLGSALKKKIKDRIYQISLVFVALYALEGSILRFFSNANPYSGAYHFSAVFSSVAQVHFGNVLLRDFYNSYGLYPHLLAPIFALIGLSPETFSFCMASLTFLTLISLIYFFQKTLRYRVFKILAMLGAVEAICFYRALPIESDFYFQYVPIRTLFPCLSLALSAHYFYKPSLVKYLGTFLILAVGLLWNLETGIIAYLSWLGCLFFQELGELHSKTSGIRIKSDYNSILLNLFKHTLAAFSLIVFVVSVYCFLIYLTYGKTPDFFSLQLVPALFYKYGYYMVETPIFHVWIYFAALCLVGFAHSASCLYRGRQSLQSFMILMVTLLATGAFSYYQGRSVTSNLIGPLYLWVTLIYILLDQLWEQTLLQKSKKLASTLFYLCLIPAIGVSFNSLGHFTEVFPEISKRYTEMKYEETNPGYLELKSLKNYILPGESTLALSLAAGVFHVITGTPPAGNDSFTELFLRKDYSHLQDVISNKRVRIIIDDQQFFLAEFEDLRTLVRQNYHLIGNTNMGRFQIWERNPA